MLVLTRKPRQRVVIGKGNFLTVTVLDITPHHVRLGFSADRSVPIVREELLLRLPTSSEDQEALEMPASQLVPESSEEEVAASNSNEALAYLH